MDPIQQIDNAAESFNQWLLANVAVRPDLVGPIPAGQQASPLRRYIARIVGFAQSLESSIRSSVAGNPSGAAEVVSALQTEYDLAKRDILAALADPSIALRSSAVADEEESNLPMIMGLVAAALLGVYLARR